MMGDGAVVTPITDTVYAPCDGQVAFVFDTKHAIGYITDDDVSLLIHIGIDTVKLGGNGFEVLIENGQKLKKGDPMMKLDLDYIKENAPSIASPILVTDMDEDKVNIKLLKSGEIKAGDPLFEIYILED